MSVMTKLNTTLYNNNMNYYEAINYFYDTHLQTYIVYYVTYFI